MSHGEEPRLWNYTHTYIYIHFHTYNVHIYSHMFIHTTAVGAAKSLESCLTLCDSADGSPPGFSLYRIL